MAGTIPTAKSFQSLLGEMIDTFVSNSRITGLKVANPILRILEAAAQSDIRSVQDLFNLLDADNLDRANSEALDRIALSEKTSRRGAVRATTKLDFTDSSFTKIASVVYPGAAAPNAGVAQIKVSDASSFPSSGQIYIGRGTTNYEGPLTYTSKSSAGSYWVLNLSSGTSKFHNINESVILAKNGIRNIPAGTVVKTSRGIIGTPVVFTTLYLATIEDGETTVEKVEAIAQVAGISGNVPKDSLTVLDSLPFTGATVNNPLPVSNGLANETDKELKERIRNLRQSKAKGTELALITNAINVQSIDDNKTVLSAAYVSTNSGADTLYIDDGTGYEESWGGIAQETLVDQALGGEKIFSVTQYPIKKAFAHSTFSTPFALVSGAKLSIKVNGVLTEHTFEASAFRAINNATAYEIVASINSNSELLFSATTFDSGTKVLLFAKTDSEEDIEVVDPDSGINANDYLGISTGINYTMKLYKNDELLYKDGKNAKITSAIQADWSTIASGVQLNVAVDGTSAVTYTFTDADFVSANTGYMTVSGSNNLNSWAKVFNSKIAGVTATVEGSRIVLSSNKGKTSLASIEVSEPTGISNNLIAKGMFTEAIGLESTGSDNDYTINRNSGLLELSGGLAENDNLTIGSNYTRAYLQSAIHNTGTITISDNGATLYVVIDGNASVLSTGLANATTLTISHPSTNILRYTASSAIFGSGSTAYIETGDYVIIWDEALDLHGVYKISFVDPSYNYFQIQVPDAVAFTQSATTLINAGMVFVRTTGLVQEIRLTAGNNRTLSSIVDEINDKIRGATASVYRNRYIRLTTNSFVNGDIFIATADSEGQNLQFTTGELKINNDSHLASIESVNSILGTPEFNTNIVTSTTGSAFNTVLTNMTAGHYVHWLRQLITSSATNRYGANKGKTYPIKEIVATTVTPRTNKTIYTINISSLSSDGTTVTGTTSINNTFKVGDVIYIYPGEANFPAGYKLITSIIGSNAFTYDEAGIVATSTAVQYVNKDDQYITTIDRAVALSPFQIGYEDALNVVLDSDISSKNYTIPMYRTARAYPSSTYTATGLQLEDNDNFNFDFDQAFGSDDPSIFEDFALYMKARAKSHNVFSGKTVLWRFNRFGPEGNNVKVEYVHNSDPDSDVSVTTTNGQYGKVQIKLPTGSLRTGLQLEVGTQFKVRVVSLTVNSTALVRTFGTTVTVTTTSDHGFSVGDRFYLTTTAPDTTDFPVGYKTVDSVITGSQFTYLEAGANVSSVNSATINGGPLADMVEYYHTVPQINVGGLVRAANVVTGTTTAAHGFSIGNVIYVTCTDPNFPSGAKTITAVPTSTTFKYNETGTAIASVAAATASGSSTIPNFNIDRTDVVKINTLSGFNTVNKGLFPVASKTATSFRVFRPIGTAVAETVPVRLGNSSYLQFFPVDTTASVVNTMLTTINTDFSHIITGAATDGGTGYIDMTTNDEYLQGVVNETSSASVDGWQLKDGINYIKSCDITAGPATFDLKYAVDSTLTSNNDYTNERFKLVPITLNGMVKWLSSKAISAFYAGSEVIASADGGKLQLSTLISGSSGSIQVTGGTANTANAELVGTGSVVDTNYSKVTISTNQTKGFVGGRYVTIDASDVFNKTAPWSSGSTIAVATGPTTTTWKISASVATRTLRDTVDFATDGADLFMIEQVGKFAVYLLVDSGGGSTFDTSNIKEGDWVEISIAGATPSNNGIKKVVRITTTQLWIEGTVTEEIVTLASGDYMKFWSYDSVMPGDKFVVDSNILGSTNRGIFEVDSFGPTVNDFYIKGMLSVKTATTLGTEYAFINVKEANPARWIKKIRTICPNPDDSENYSDVIFESSEYATKLSANSGCIMTALDKLEFDTSVVAGVDGYSYNTGLLKEVAKVIFGVKANPTVYPGVAAAGAKINISGPLVKRIQVSMSLRLETGVSSTSIINKVKSAIATVINQSPIGKSIDISRLVKAARTIEGVAAVTVLSPTYSPGNDLINVQSNEKPLVLDIDNDILISIVGL